MNREIKFRAYDTKKKEWLLGYELSHLGGFSMFGETMMLGEYSAILSEYFPNRWDDICLMQFTGLSDSKGKEIYEGDIIMNPEWKKMIGEIKWKDTGWDADYYFMTKGEIIGNVLENPELLK